MIDKVFKDNIGQEVNIGDKVAWKQGGYSCLIIGKIIGFTKTGMAKIENQGRAKETFVKIFEQ